MTYLPFPKALPAFRRMAFFNNHMSYDIQLFRVETKLREQQQDNEHFFDHDENLEPFSVQQQEALKERLLQYDYVLISSIVYGHRFRHTEHAIDVLLTDRGLYFNASLDEDCIFEAGMTASEFTDTGEYEKYDPQSGGWEEV